MSIKTKLQISLILPLLLLLVVMFILFYSYKQGVHVTEQVRITNQIAKKVFELNILTYDYLMNRERRAEMQWCSLYDSIQILIDKLNREYKTLSLHMMNIEKSYKDIGNIFRGITENDKRDVLDENETALLKEDEDILIGQLLTKSRIMVSDSFELSDTGFRRRSKSIQRSNIFVVLFTATITIILSFFSFVIIRSIILPVKRLQAGIEIISKGNLNHKTGITSKDEIGLLSEAFDRMTEDLKAFTISYEILSKEINERKKAEKQVQQYNRELEKRNEEMQRLAFIVSHDLRAPLVNIKGFASELRFSLDTVVNAVNDLITDLSEEQKRDLHNALAIDIPEAMGYIDSSANRMDSLINAILKYSRMGRRNIQIEHIDMNQLVDETIKTLHYRIHEQGVTIVQGDLPDINADRVSMEQIMGNILNNAVTYLNPGRPGKVEITGERGEEMTFFHIEDNGRGIAGEEIQKVFALFGRAGSQDIPGEGMGLAYVQTLVRRHDGEITCKSEPGEGTTFTFTVSNNLEIKDPNPT